MTGAASTIPSAADGPAAADAPLNVNVGVLGHVDSGKTSLVKALSTHLSTAALDKSRQSRERGMTLDLGFSCFRVAELPRHLREAFPDRTALQVTLVDCPGHAGLIRTVIGGAQIVDAALLVVDAQKGWQAQTTECLVLAELTAPHLLVALNKVDLLVGTDPERRSQLEAAKAGVRDRLARTRFRNAAIVEVAACVGGEKVAAVADDAATAAAAGKPETLNLEALVELLTSQLPVPRRSARGPFHFAVDHCFALRGRGTVLTGTVLSGAASVNDVLEFPALSLERRIKSIQMFGRPAPTIRQGDRAGVCVSNLDAKLLERGIAASPGAVRLWRGAVAVVRRIRYYPGELPSGSRFHISVGHATVMATVTFWGARELWEAGTVGGPLTDSRDSPDKEDRPSSSSLGGGTDVDGLPQLTYDFETEYRHQDRLYERLDGVPAEPEEPYLHWALISFQTPVHCPLQSLVIGSRLDTVDNASGAVSSCRLSFAGRLVAPLDPSKDLARLRIYVPKEKRGAVGRLGDPHTRSDDGRMVRYEVFGSGLFKKETNLKPFLGMRVETDAGEVGVIKSSYGTDGMFRVQFPAGTECQPGDPLYLRFRRYDHDPTKGMHQDVALPADRPGVRVEVVKKTRRLPDGVHRHGTVAALKGATLANGKLDTAIVAGLFAPEINIKEAAGGARVFVPSTKEEGRIVGPFGKAGKCKVAFEQGVSAEVGAKVELQL